MSERTILLLTFIVCVVITINVFHVCHTWQIVTLMNLMGVPKEVENETDNQIHIP